MAEVAAPRKFESLEEVREYARRNERDLLLLDDAVLDVTTFAPHHPGGAVLLRSRKGGDVAAEMKWHHPLSLHMANTMAIGSFRRDIERVISPARGLLPQIWGLNHEQYMHVVYSPHWLFVESPPMFDSEFLNSFTHCKWYLVPLMPVIVVSYMLSLVDNWSSLSVPQALLTAFAGLLFFTFIEYFLHRFIFHSEKHLPDSRLARYIHFLAHGIHHMLPNDPDRLVLPPPMYCVIFALGYFTVGKVVRFEDPLTSAIFWSFFQLGYVGYDLIHYALHHIDASSSKGGYFLQLQRYHNQHHFGGEEAGFGVSSKLWDVILRTGFRRSKKQAKQ